MADNECPVCHRPVNRRKHRSGMHKSCEKRFKQAKKVKLAPTFGTGQST